MADTTDTTTPAFIAPEAAAETSGDSTDMAAAKAAEGVPEVDYRAKFEAQQKVNRDLERKFKEAAGAKDRVAALEESVARFEGKEAEYKAAQDAQRVKDEALTSARRLIASAQLQLAAKGKVNEDILPDIALFIDPSNFEVAEDGSVDTDAVAQAITDLITKKPSLGAQGGQRFQGSADGGARNGSQTSIDDQIAEATKAGNLQLAIALKQQRSAELLAKK